MFKTKFGKKVKLPEAPVEQTPRSIPEINEEFSKLCAEAGKAYFESKILEAELQRSLQRRLQLGAEANKRAELDAANPPKEEVKEDASQDTPSTGG